MNISVLSAPLLEHASPLHSFNAQLGQRWSLTASAYLRLTDMY